jgi:hypothetical protein
MTLAHVNSGLRKLTHLSRVSGLCTGSAMEEQHSDSSWEFECLAEVLDLLMRLFRYRIHSRFIVKCQALLSGCIAYQTGVSLDRHCGARFAVVSRA